MASRKLTRNDVIEIKRLLRDTAKTQVEIAEQFEVNDTSVSGIANERYWSDVSPDDEKNDTRLVEAFSGGHLDRQTTIRFVDRIKIDEDSGCWKWQGGTASEYGVFGIDYEKKYTHRLALILSGTELDDKYALHHCDNKRCVNPEHLYPGHATQNSLDAVNRGQIATGHESHRSDFSEEDIVDIKRQLRTTDKTQKEIADEHSVTQPTISMIKNQKFHTEIEP